jgi:hypothetical protein
LGCLILIAGITTALTGLVAIERAHAIIEWCCSRDPASSVAGAFLSWPSEASSHMPALPLDALPNQCAPAMTGVEVYLGGGCETLLHRLMVTSPPPTLP